MQHARIIMDGRRFLLTVERLCHQLIEVYDAFDEVCIIGVQPRGTWLADRIYQRLQELGVPALPYGKLDITFYRDDFRTHKKPLKASPTEMDFLVEKQRVVLVDDVLYTGRTIQAALTALNHYGRPADVALLALVERRFNRELPIRPDFTGMVVDAVDEAYVQVQYEQHHGTDQILLFPHKPGQQG